MSSGATLQEAVETLREAARLDKGRFSTFFNLSRALRRLKDETEKEQKEDHVTVAAGTPLPALLQKVRKEKSQKKEVISDIAAERIDALRVAHNINGQHAGVCYQLGMALKEKGESEESIHALEAYLCIMAGEGQALQETAKRRTAGVKHWLAYLKGEASATAPPEYVAGLFDFYAEKFDDHLVNQLDYNTPELLSDEIRRARDALSKDADSGTLKFRRCADLGCGTGLMGPKLRERDLGVEWLEGVDLSSGMLQKAREKERGYDRLICGDLVDVFEAGQDGESPVFDLVVAADVFVYVGDLQPSLAAAARCLAKPHGLVAFSTEAPPRSGSANEKEQPVAEGGFRLAETGRYMHSAAYVRTTAEACGFGPGRTWS